MTDLERVARAIGDALRPMLDLESKASIDTTVLARAAVEALMEPSPAVEAAMCAADGMTAVDSALVIAAAHGYRLQWEAKGQVKGHA